MPPKCQVRFTKFSNTFSAAMKSRNNLGNRQKEVRQNEIILSHPKITIHNRNHIKQ